MCVCVSGHTHTHTHTPTHTHTLPEHKIFFLLNILGELRRVQSCRGHFKGDEQAEERWRGVGDTLILHHYSPPKYGSAGAGIARSYGDAPVDSASS